MRGRPRPGSVAFCTAFQVSSASTDAKEPALRPGAAFPASGSRGSKTKFKTGAYRPSLAGSLPAGCRSGRLLPPPSPSAPGPADGGCPPRSRRSTGSSGQKEGEERPRCTSFAGWHLPGQRHGGQFPLETARLAPSSSSRLPLPPAAPIRSAAATNQTWYPQPRCLYPKALALPETAEAPSRPLHPHPRVAVGETGHRFRRWSSISRTDET